MSNGENETIGMIIAAFVGGNALFWGAIVLSLGLWAGDRNTIIGGGTSVVSGVALVVVGRKIAQS